MLGLITSYDVCNYLSARFTHTAPCTSNPPAPRATVLLVLLGGVCPELVSGVLAMGAQGTICVRWVKY